MIQKKIQDRILKALAAEGAMDTKVIAGFPGIGKSACTRRDPTLLDSDSSLFSWKFGSDGNPILDADGRKVRDPEFPANYIAHIQSMIGKVPAIFISSHAVVRDALVDAGIRFNLVYPDRSLKDEYLARYIERGNPPAFVDMISANWDDFLDELDAQAGCHKVVLQQGEYMADALQGSLGVSNEVFDGPVPDQVRASSPITLGRR